MSVFARPTDTVTKGNLFIGLPIVLFERKLANGSFDTPRNLGIVDSAELQKVVNVAQLRNRSSGVSVLERELVRQLEPSLVIGMFNFEPENMRLFLAGKTLTTVASSTPAVTDDVFVAPQDPKAFGKLANRLITTEPLTALTYQTVTDENVGTGDGTSGDTSGDFALDYTVAAVGDVTSVTVGGVAFTPIAVAAAASGNEVEVVVGASSTSGNLRFAVGGVYSNVTGQILATYTPSHTLTSLTEYVLDPQEGRLRIRRDTGEPAEFKVSAGQALLADYSYTQPDETQFDAFTQSTFEGRATIQHLTDDAGVNFIWDVPSVSIRVNDDAFAWNADDFAVGSLTMNILQDPSQPTKPFGTFRQFPEQ